MSSTARCPARRSGIRARPHERQEHLEALRAHHRHLEGWAQNCPENFSDRAALVGAEIARIQGRELDAEHLYQEAIRAARANGLVHNEALAHELAARFYAGRGFEEFAHLYLQKARHGYLRWGADGKVRQLDELYPYLRQEEALPAPAGTIAAPVEQLDLATVFEVSQAVSGEIVLDKLIDKLMRTALEHAGAQRGLLIAVRGGALELEAQAATAGNDVIVDRAQAAIETAALPASIVNYVMHTHEVVILDDAGRPNPFSDDEYIRATPARSMLCLPLIKQGQVGRPALPREQPGSRCVHARQGRSVEAARLRGGDLAGEQPPLPRAPGTGRQDPAPGRLEHRRGGDLGSGRPHRGGQRCLSKDAGI